MLTGSSTGQDVILNTNDCIYVGNIMHELLHSLGNELLSFRYNSMSPVVNIYSMNV